ncbi:MAG: DKNYY domain-containing protein [Saprospiraceae bacterium]|nr:DKNYY domain-containing protein [Saprospiraceae bacterium]MDZ4705841.1 DKNYY domain-containing protein [Saprospiraceae bacterium]
MIILGLFSALFGCGGDGKPGLFSSMGLHVSKSKVWYKQSASGYEFYRVNEVNGADPTTFQILKEISGCSRDAKYAYAWDVRIKDVDPNKFPADKASISCDETGVIFEQ